MKKLLLLVFPLLSGAVALAQAAGPAGAAAEGEGISFRTIMNIVFGVMALALLAIGIWYWKLKKENE